MSKAGPHDECNRRIAELEALVAGQASEIERLSNALDQCERRATRLVLDVQKAIKKGTT